MSAGSNLKSVKQNENFIDDLETHKKTSHAEGNNLTFKDWKTIKDGETESNTVNRETKSKNVTTNCNRDYRKNNADFIVQRQGNAGFPRPYRSTPKTLNGVNNCDIRGTAFGTYNSSYYNSFNIFGFYNFNGFGRHSNFIKNGYNMLNNSNDQHANYGRKLPDCFFTSDGIYRQRDLMQKPLPKPFKNEAKAKQSQNPTSVQYNVIKDPRNVSNNIKNLTPPPNNNISLTKSLGEEAKIYVPNPNAFKDGKAFIPKPKLPEENHQISKEEKKRQWKEYREAMKPFKNREFYNAKRVVQRLGKKDINQLNEKELFRLTNAREVMNSHKARLTAKYSGYVKTESQSNELGEVYVLRTSLSKDLETGEAKEQNYNIRKTHGENVMEPGRKILGGYSSVKGFAPVGMLEVSTQRIGQIPVL